MGCVAFLPRYLGSNNSSTELECGRCLMLTPEDKARIEAEEKLRLEIRAKHDKDSDQQSLLAWVMVIVGAGIMIWLFLIK